MVQGSFAGMCGMSRFHVCCLLTESENDSAEEDQEYLKGPAPPEEYLVSSEEDILDTFSALARNAVEQGGFAFNGDKEYPSLHVYTKYDIH